MANNKIKVGDTVHEVGDLGSRAEVIALDDDYLWLRSPDPNETTRWNGHVSTWIKADPTAVGWVNIPASLIVLPTRTDAEAQAQGRSHGVLELKGDGTGTFHPVKRQ